MKKWYNNDYGLRFYCYFCQRCDIYEENTYHIMKQVVKLTESDIHNIVRQVVNEALNEITISQASVGGIYNTLSMNDINNGNSTVTFGRGRKSSVNRLEKSND